MVTKAGISTLLLLSLSTIFGAQGASAQFPPPLKVFLQPSAARAGQKLTVTVAIPPHISLQHPQAIYRVYGTDGNTPTDSVIWPSFNFPNFSDVLLFQSPAEPLHVQVSIGKWPTYKFQATFTIPDSTSYRPALFVLPDIIDFHDDGSFVLLTGSARLVLQCKNKDSHDPKSTVVTCTYKTPALIASESVGQPPAPHPPHD